MLLLDKILSLLAPHACLGCSREGALLCADCATSLPLATERCYRCQQLSPNGLTCDACLNASSLLQVQSVTRHAALGQQLIHRLKYSGAVAASEPISRSMSGIIDGLDCVIVPVPTSNARRRQRGYDQAELIARAISRHTGLPLARLLARHGELHQIGANRQQRQLQLQHVFRVRQLVSGAPILLIDDVVTTGSTLEAAAKALWLAGATDIRALTFAQA